MQRERFYIKNEGQLHGNGITIHNFFIMVIFSHLCLEKKWFEVHATPYKYQWYGTC